MLTHFHNPSATTPKLKEKNATMLPGLSELISEAKKDICKTPSRAEEHREDRS
jgi:hypothetical protein